MGFEISKSVGRGVGKAGCEDSNIQVGNSEGRKSGRAAGLWYSNEGSGLSVGCGCRGSLEVNS